MREHILGQTRKFHVEDETYKLTIVNFLDPHTAVVRVDYYKGSTVAATHTVQMSEGELADVGFDI